MSDTTAAQTTLSHDDLAARLTARFPAVTTSVAFGELTVHADAASLVALLTFCRDDEAIGCELLADLSGVHWPAGGHTIERQPTTTGWPTFRFSEKEGVVEVLYMLRSLRHGHVLRVAVATDDTEGSRRARGRRGRRGRLRRLPPPPLVQNLVHEPVGTNHQRSNRAPTPSACSPTSTRSSVVGATLAEQHDEWQISDRRCLTKNNATVLDLEQPITLELEAD